jgi:hypothetical protein
MSEQMIPETNRPPPSPSETYPENTISKTMALSIVVICFFTGFLGYAFGADAGYKKAMDDCRSLPAPEVIISP